MFNLRGNRCAAIALPWVILNASPVFAGTIAVAEPSSAVPRGLQLIDWGIIGLYIMVTICLGIYYGRKQESTEEYFIGSGNMNPILIGVSLFATLLSTISYLSFPGEAAGRGPVIVVSIFALPFAYFIVSYWLLPVYMKHRVTSAYELLELRLGLSVRLLGATLFLLLRLVWMSILVFAAAKAMTVMMGVHDDWIPWIVIVVGVVAVIYTTLGGLRAVVITDCLQTILLYGGALAVIGVVTWSFGGLGWFPTAWETHWDTQPLFSLDPRVRMTWVGTILSILVWTVATAGGDQTAVQRFMSTKDASAARKAYAVQLLVTLLVTVTLCIAGFALLGYFKEQGLPSGYDMKADGDSLFPWFIAYVLPPGISGLVVAAMFAAAMSSIDSGINSITAVVMTDFLDRFGLRPTTQKGHVRAARLLALTVGVIVVLLSSYVKYIPGNLTEGASKVVNLLPPSLFALFIFALFVRRSTVLGVWAGAICGITVAAIIGFSGPLVTLLATRFEIDPGLFGVELITTVDKATGLSSTSAADPISFLWMAPVSLMVNVSVGLLVSRLFPPTNENQNLGEVTPG